MFHAIAFVLESLVKNGIIGRAFLGDFEGLGFSAGSAILNVRFGMWEGVQGASTFFGGASSESLGLRVRPWSAVLNETSRVHLTERDWLAKPAAELDQSDT